MKIIAGNDQTAELDGAKFRFNLSFETKLAMLRCRTTDQNEPVDVAKLVETVYSQNAVIGWEGVAAIDENGVETPFAFGEHSFKDLPGDVQIEVALKAFELAFGGNRTGSESK